MAFGILVVCVLGVVVMAGAYMIPYTIVRRCGKIAMVITCGLYGVYLVELVASTLALGQTGEIASDPIAYIVVIMFMFASQICGVYGIVRGYKNRKWY